MRAVTLLFAVILLAGCNLGGSNVKPDGKQVVVRASCGITEKLAGDCLAHPPMQDLANAQSIAQAVDRAVVTPRAEVVAGQQVQVFGALTITPPSGLASVRDLTRDKDAGEFIGNVTRFASNLSTPTSLLVQSAAQRDLANHLLRQWRITTVAVTVGDGKNITIKRQ